MKTLQELVHSLDLGREHGGLQGKGMQLAAHAALQRLVDHLVLLDAAHARESLGRNSRGEMVAVADLPLPFLSFLLLSGALMQVRNQPRRGAG